MAKLGWVVLALILVGSCVGGCSSGGQKREQDVQELLSKYEAGKREFVSVRLEGAGLQEQDLRWINFVQADFRRADLTDVQLVGSALIRADLREARLTGADLRWSDLTEADLRGADLSGADLTEAILKNAKLEGANLHGARVTEEQLARAESLKGATLPDGTVHE